MENKIEELSDQYALLERDFVKNKFAEIEESKKQILSLLKWFLGVSGASLAFFITNSNKEILNYLEIQILLLSYFYLGIFFIVFLELKYSYFCNKQKKLYCCIQKHNYNKLEQIVFTTYEEHYLLDIKNFPDCSYFVIILVSFSTFLFKYYPEMSKIKFEPNVCIYEKITTYLTIIKMKLFIAKIEEFIYIITYYIMGILTLYLVLLIVIFIIKKVCNNLKDNLY